MGTIIIADDSRIARAFVRAILVEEGHQVIAEASNGEEGYELYAKHRPDLLVLDITMPVLNGIECLKRIKAEFPEAKVIMITSLGKESKKVEALNEGADGYITKPFEPFEVTDAVNRCLDFASVRRSPVGLKRR